MGHTEYCGSTEMGSGACGAKRERARVGYGSLPDQGTAHAKLEAGGGGPVRLQCGVWGGQREKEAKRQQSPE